MLSMNKIPKEDKNPILYFIGDTPIRKYNIFKIALSEYELKKLAEISQETGLPMARIMAIQGQPCSVCGNDNVVINVPKNVMRTKGVNVGDLKLAPNP